FKLGGVPRFPASSRSTRRTKLASHTRECSGAAGSPRSRRQVDPGTARVVRILEGVSMKRYWTALAVALVAIFAEAGCNDYGNTFQNNTGAGLAFLSPAQMSAGSVDFTLTVNGQGFVLKTVVQWNGKPLATTVPVDSTGVAIGNIVTATVPAALVAKPGVATIITVNPASGAGQNGLSNPLAFTINPPPNPLPGLTGISPGSAPATFYICPSSGCPPGTPASVSAAALVAEETPALSLDGRYVAYTAVQNDHAQVFLRDTCEGAASACQSHTTLLSTAADGTAANDDSRTPSISADG